MKIADDGEILLRGDNIFQGYYKNEEASKEALEGGWLHTGDLGRIDEDGFVYISGRKKDIIITAGGKNITPANLENGIKQNQYVSQCVVVGDRRPYLVALVTLDPEVATEETPEIRESIQETIDEVNSKVGPGRADQVLQGPAAGPLAGDRRADADDEGQAQRRPREVRGRDRLALRAGAGASKRDSASAPCRGKLSTNGQ